jgi:hypothetical protein
MDSEDFKRLERHFKRKRRTEDEEIIDKILKDLKKQHGEQRRATLEKLQQQIDKIRMGLNLCTQD